MISSELCQKSHTGLLRRHLKNISDAVFVALEGIIEQTVGPAQTLRQLPHSVWAILKGICCPCSKKSLKYALIQEALHSL